MLFLFLFSFWFAFDLIFFFPYYFHFFVLDLLEEYGVELKGPFNYSARDEAGIPRHW